jgi:hypothetical protein
VPSEPGECARPGSAARCVALRLLPTREAIEQVLRTVRQCSAHTGQRGPKTPTITRPIATRPARVLTSHTAILYIHRPFMDAQGSNRASSSDSRPAASWSDCRSPRVIQHLKLG